MPHPTSVKACFGFAKCPAPQSTQSAAPSSQSSQTSTSAFLAEIASTASQSDQDAERQPTMTCIESLSAWRKNLQKQDRRQASEAHAQLRQLEKEKSKAQAAKAQARKQRKVLCFGCCAAKVLSDLLLPRAVTKTDAHTHDVDAVAHGPCLCLLFCQSAK